MADRESAWKELMEQDAKRVLAFFWPDIHDDLDWAQDVESLEQEFRAQVPQAEEGKRIVDKLLRGHQKATGDLRYLHVEIQAHFEQGFERRIYVYNSRAEDRYGQPVVSLVLLIGDDPKWFPKRYVAELYNTKRSLTFRSIKVAKWQNKVAKLEKDANPVGLFVAAYLEGRRLKDDEPGRAAAKLRLLQNLRARGKTIEVASHWYDHLEWLLPLSPQYNRRVSNELDRTRKEGEMSRKLTFADRLVMEKAIAFGLEVKFGKEGLALMPQIEELETTEAVQAIMEGFKPNMSLDDVRTLIPAPANGHS